MPAPVRQEGNAVPLLLRLAARSWPLQRAGVSELSPACSRGAGRQAGRRAAACRAGAAAAGEQHRSQVPRAALCKVSPAATGDDVSYVFPQTAEFGPPNALPSSRLPRICRPAVLLAEGAETGPPGLGTPGGVPRPGTAACLGTALPVCLRCFERQNATPAVPKCKGLGSARVKAQPGALKRKKPPVSGCWGWLFLGGPGRRGGRQDLPWLAAMKGRRRLVCVGPTAQFTAGKEKRGEEVASTFQLPHVSSGSRGGWLNVLEETGLQAASQERTDCSQPLRSGRAALGEPGSCRGKSDAQAA